MREIKFRAWNGKGMIYSGSTDLKFYVEAHYGRPCILDRDEHNEWGIHNVDWQLMQYTGMDDLKGQEIYEDDIVTYDNRHYRIIFDGCWSLQPTNKSSFEEIYVKDPCLYDLEVTHKVHTAKVDVVSNIYENPELLKGDTHA